MDPGARVTARHHGVVSDDTPAEIDRHQVLAYRVAAQGLDRTTDDPAALDLMDLGLQDSNAGSAVAAVVARVSDPATTFDDRRRWATTWSLRGAPHVHRQGDLRGLAAALWPVDRDDAIARLAGNGAQMKKAGADALAILRATAEALAAVVDHRMTKGEASEAVTPRVPEDGVTWCRSCDTHHVGEQLLRLAALPAGLRLVPGATPATLEPIPRWPGPPTATDGLGRLITAVLRTHGPARRPDVAAYLDAVPGAVKAAWPDADLAEVHVDGRLAWVAADALDPLLSAPAPRLTRLLPRSDPWLTARDRELTVPDADRRRAVWKILGSPGAVRSTARCSAPGERERRGARSASRSRPSRTSPAGPGATSMTRPSASPPRAAPTTSAWRSPLGDGACRPAIRPRCGRPRWSPCGRRCG